MAPDEFACLNVRLDQIRGDQEGQACMLLATAPHRWEHPSHLERVTQPFCEAWPKAENNLPGSANVGE